MLMVIVITVIVSYALIVRCSWWAAGHASETTDADRSSTSE